MIKTDSEFIGYRKSSFVCVFFSVDELGKKFLTVMFLFLTVILSIGIVPPYDPYGYMILSDINSEKAPTV